MKKRSVQKGVKVATIGLELGDQTSPSCRPNPVGEAVEEPTIPTTRSDGTQARRVRAH